MTSDYSSQKSLLQHGGEALLKGRYDEAHGYFEAVLASYPNNIDALSGLAHLHGARGEFRESVARADQVLVQSSGHRGALTVKGVAMRMLGQWEGALTCFNQVLAMDPANVVARAHRSVVFLMLGDFARGLVDHEYRLALPPYTKVRWPSNAPLWRNESSIAGRTIILFEVQGLGDVIQFSRYVPMIADLGGRAIIRVPPKLVSLIETLPRAPMVIPDNGTVPTHDFQCPLTSLPLAFQTSLDHIPSIVPYLSAPLPTKQEWARKLGPKRRLRVGLAWRGHNYFPFADPRAIPLDFLRPLLDMDVDFIVLQHRVTNEESATLDSYRNVSRAGESLDDFGDIAGIVEHTDLVITVDTSFAHLAGAMGKPTWIMHRFAGCWRWLLDRPDSPWYPTVRLFRQPSAGEWAPVVNEIQQCLQKTYFS